MEAIGRKRWAIAEGYIPSESSFSHRALVSHETACILNAGDRDAHVTITIFFADRDPVGPYDSPLPHAGRCICVSTISTNPRRSRAIPITPRYSNRMCRSSCSIPGSIPGTPRSRCCPPWPIRKDDRRATFINGSGGRTGTFRIATRFDFSRFSRRGTHENCTDLAAHGERAAAVVWW